MEKSSLQKTVKIQVDTEPIEPQKQPDHKNLPRKQPTKPPKQQKRGCSGCGCFSFLFIAAVLLYFLFPLPNHFLLLGIDRSPAGTMTGRSDTMMAFSVNPLLQM